MIAFGRHMAALGAALVLTTPAAAQTEAEAAAQNMQLAAELCLKWFRQPPELQSRLGAAGFSLSPGMDANAFEAQTFGVGVQAGADEGGFCKVESSLVPMPLARAIADAVVARVYTGSVAPGLPNDTANAPPGQCQGMTLWDSRPVITIGFSAAGNSGECLMDGTSAIFMN